jgi:hypothetical protein
MNIISLLVYGSFFAWLWLAAFRVEMASGPQVAVVTLAVIWTAALMAGTRKGKGQQ